MAPPNPAPPPAALRLCAPDPRDDRRPDPPPRPPDRDLPPEWELQRWLDLSG